MFTLGLAQKPIVMPHYPHLLHEDAAVWTKYLADPISPIQHVWYDVHVGAPVKLAPGASDLDKRIAAGLTRKRIDVVAAVGGGFWVIELKPLAGYQALGQVMTYFRLFVQEHRPPGQVWPVIICNQVDADVIPDFDNFGVVCIVV